MAVRVQCPNPNCGKAYRVEETQLGRRSVCKHCGQEFTLTASGRETLAPAANTDTSDSAPAKPVEYPIDGTPKKLGRFEIRSRLGSGAFGTVYRAHDPVLDREVALKVPRAAALEKPEARARFLREPKAAARLRHPHIVPVYDAGTDGEHYYIASAYIEGHTLEHVIDLERPDFRRAAEIVRDLAAALHYAHGMGVIHRDVKPANIMIDRQGHALLMDFGLARLEASEEKITQDGSLMGTPAYMAPEQADNSFGEVGAASDQYSLGVLLYELLCGETPFSGPPTVLIYNIVSQEPPSPRAGNPQIPRDLETICLKAMCKAPHERYTSCEDLADDLRRWLADEPVHARRMSRLEQLLRWCKRNPALAGLSSASATLLILVAALAVAGYIREAKLRGETEKALSRAQEAEGKKAAAFDDAERERQIAQRERDGAQEAQAKEVTAREEADRQRQIATQQRDVAEQARTKEAAARAQAEDQRQIAIQQRQAAEEARDREAAQRRQAEANLYFHQIALAQLNLLRGDLRVAESLLKACKPELRHWEWGYLNRLGDRNECTVFRGHSDLTNKPSIQELAFSADGSYITSTDVYLRVKVWSVSTGEEVNSINLANMCKQFSDSGRCIFDSTDRVTSDGRWVAVPISKDTIRVLDTSAGEERTDIYYDGFVHGPGIIAISPDGTRVACGGQGQTETGAATVTLLAWDVKTGKSVSGPIVVPGRVQTGGLMFSSDGARIALRARGQHIFDVTSGRDVLSAPVAGAILAFSPDGTRVASSTESGIDICDIATGEKVLTLEGHSAGRLAYSGDGKRIVGGGFGHIWLWDAMTGREILGLPAPRHGVTCVAFGPNGKRIAAGGMDGSVHVWEAAMDDDSNAPLQTDSP